MQVGHLKRTSFERRSRVARSAASRALLALGLGGAVLAGSLALPGELLRAGLPAAMVAAFATGRAWHRHRRSVRSVQALTTAVHAVCARGDYSVRVTGAEAAELAPVHDAFNRMLQQIQEQDHALRVAREELEARVRERVSELRQEVQERRGVEAALRASQEQLKSVVENSTNLFYSHTPNQRVAYVSPQTHVFLDCAPEDAPIAWTEWLSDDPVNAQALAARERAVCTGERQAPYEAELISRTGRRVRVEANEAPIVQGGRVVLIVGALTDITDRKRVENEKARLEEQLRQAQKMEAVGRLAGGVAHDFNNLLGVITGYGELLMRQLEPASPHRKRVEQMLKATERAIGLTRQLLTFSRKQVADRRPLDLAPVVLEMEKMLRHMIGEDVDLTVETESPLGVVRADPGQMEQVLMNLAVNARDAMPNGGALRVRLANHDGAVTESGESTPCVVLEVSDTGCGMDAATLSHIFEPFFTTKEKGKGTGLGLATVYGIVQQSGGRIDVDSRVGAGTTFRIYLPRVDEPVQRQAAPVQPVRGGRETVLLVEDEVALRDLVAEILGSAGYFVIAAASAPEALAKAKMHRGPIHMLLTDVVMPALSGPELAAQVRELRPQVAVLYMSGYTEEFVARQRGLEANARLLQKPFHGATLLQCVRETLAANAETATALTA